MTDDRTSFPSRIIADFHEGYCNLKCPKCLLHSAANKRKLDKVRGEMPLEKICRLFDEAAPHKTVFQPALWSEPLTSPFFRDYVQEAGAQGVPLAMNTNGLLLTEALAGFIVKERLSSVFVSIDAMTAETLQAVRGTDQLDHINEMVYCLLSLRGESLIPRIGVSFVLEDANRHELDTFIAKWTRHVDVVRVVNIYENAKLQATDGEPVDRVPCSALYHTIAIHHNGDVSVCCLDGFCETHLGNVFETSVADVWNGEKANHVRQIHEQGMYDKYPFCRDCNIWANFAFKEETIGNLLIRRSSGMTYYNRLDRLASWNGTLRTGHPGSSQ
jgi:radical SAM protein with 4Fe4S-binding SPASM domain